MLTRVATSPFFFFTTKGWRINFYRGIFYIWLISDAQENSHVEAVDVLKGENSLGLFQEVCLSTPPPPAPLFSLKHKHSSMPYGIWLLSSSQSILFFFFCFLLAWKSVYFYRRGAPGVDLVECKV